MAVERLRKECEGRGKMVQFRLFERYDLNESDDDASYADLAREFNIAVTDVTNYLAFSCRQFRRIALDRDLKPENIMVGPFGEVLVMDWGLAMMLQDSDTHGGAAGTAGYMAPEQAQAGAARLDERADIYSLGAILQFLTSGQTVDRPLRAILQKAMAPEAASRYASVNALAGDIAAYLDGLPVAAYPETMLDRSRRFLQKHRLAVGLVIAYAAVRLWMQVLFGA